MKIVEPSATIVSDFDRETVLEHLANVARTCYQSSPKGDPALLIASICNKGHESIIEHYSVSVRFVVDRGVSHELVRHRVASFAQESTRYCNYSKEKFGREITFVQPPFWNDGPNAVNCRVAWQSSCSYAERMYFELLDNGSTPEQARSVLPNSLKTEVVMTANLREWRHFFKLRSLGMYGRPHPQMIEVAVPLYNQFRIILPEIFDMGVPNGL